ncbi:MAG: FtsX-like permease family protein [Candidatus Acidiferrum sp.]
MIHSIVFSNVLHRPIRTAVSILAVAIEVSMVLLVVGMTTGMLNDNKRRVEGVGADVMIQPPSASFMLGLSAAPVPATIANAVARLPYVAAVSPVLLQTNMGKGLNVVWGIDTPSFDSVTGGFAYIAGGPMSNPQDILVDDLYARANNLKVGQTLNLLNHDFHLSGIVDHGKGGRVFMRIETAQDLSGALGRASIFFVKASAPEYADEVVARVKKLLPNYKVLSMAEYGFLMSSSNIPAFNAFVTVLISVSVGVGFLVIFLAMYSAVNERTREIGIYKALGMSKGLIILLIEWEAGLLCLAGIVAGYGGILILSRVIRTSFPTLPIEPMTLGWMCRAGLLALAGSFLGAVYPALRAVHLDAVESLSFE